MILFSTSGVMLKGGGVIVGKLTMMESMLYVTLQGFIPVEKLLFLLG